MTKANPRMSEQTRLAIEHVLLRGWYLAFEPGIGQIRKHPRYAVIDSTGRAVATATTQEQAIFKAWMCYVFDDTA